MMSDALTQAARDRAAALGLPTSALEDWRYVRCDALAFPGSAELEPGIAELHSARTDTGRVQLGDPRSPTLTLLNGAIHQLTACSDAWQISTPDTGSTALQALAIAQESDHATVWSLADGGARQVLRLGRNRAETLQVLNQVTAGRSGWRLRIEVAAGATLDLIVRHQSAGPARSCPGIDLSVGHGATVRVSEIVEGPWHTLLTSHTIEQAQDSTVRWVSATAGGTCVRLRTLATLNGRGASLDLHGVAVVRGTNQAHHLTRVIHGVPDTSSNQLVKAILHDQASTSFDGVVRILPGAIGSKAEQQNRNLLLSDKARADTRPQLDIKADDVQAAHGATVGQLDADEVLYLRCRGLPLAQAVGVLTAGFTDEVLELMPDAALRAVAIGGC